MHRTYSPAIPIAIHGRRIEGIDPHMRRKRTPSAADHEGDGPHICSCRTQRGVSATKRVQRAVHLEAGGRDLVLVKLHSAPEQGHVLWGVLAREGVPDS